MKEYLYSYPEYSVMAAYAVIFILVVFFFKVIVLRDKTKRMEVPEPTHFSPLDIALISGGVKAMIRTAIISLANKKALSITFPKEGRINLRSFKKFKQSLKGIEKKVYNITKGGTKIEVLFSPSEMKSYAKTIRYDRERLQKVKLLPDKKIIKRARWSLFFGIVILLTAGVISLSYISPKDQYFLIMIGIIVISVIAILLIIRPKKRKIPAITRKFLDVCNTRFEFVKDKMKKDDTLEINDVLYGVALYGISIFRGAKQRTGYGHLDDVFVDDDHIWMRFWMDNDDYEFESDDSFDKIGDYFDETGGCGDSYSSDSGDSGSGDSDSGGGCSSCSGGCGGCGGD